MGMAYLSLLQFFLLGAALLALCQFASSLSENLVVVAVIGVAATAALLFIPFLTKRFLPATPMVSFIGLVVLALLAGGVAFLATHNLNVTAITCAALVVPLSVVYILAKDVFGGLLADLLYFVSPFIHFATFCEYGTLSIASLLLLLSYPVFFIFLTVQSADKKRWD
jgi:ABC-2 type transport system permease protein